jgi:excisionase family DNA binding protein
MSAVRIFSLNLTEEQFEILKKGFALLEKLQQEPSGPMAHNIAEYLTVKEAAAFLKLSVRTLWVHIHDKESFPFTKSGRKYLIKKADLIQFMNERSYHPGAITRKDLLSTVELNHKLK